MAAGDNVYASSGLIRDWFYPPYFFLPLSILFLTINYRSQRARARAPSLGVGFRDNLFFRGPLAPQRQLLNKKRRAE